MCPSRHFSGRGLKRNTTLWCSYAILAEETKIFFSGDGGYGTHFKSIGEKIGPFDITLLECGQYNENWPNIHMTPGETIMAHEDLKGDVLIPIHWAKFDLSMHSWTEPIETLQKANVDKQFDILTPQIGRSVSLAHVASSVDWWEGR